MAVFRDARHADKVIEWHFRNNRKWGARDRRFFAESVYESVRWWRRRWVEAGLPRDRWNCFADLTSDLAWQVWSVDWEIRTKSKVFSVSLSEAESHSVPDWLWDLFFQEFANKAGSILAALNKPAEVYIRANTLKISKDQLVERLKQEGVEVQPEGPEHCLRLLERKNVFATKAFKEGLFEMQDISSQEIAPLLDPQPGERVVDACAGAGGKTLHIAALMGNRGKVIAMDIHRDKLSELRQRCRRNAVDIVEVRPIEGRKVIKRLYGSADRVLLDVPCSGLGVLRRNPDTKWKLSPQRIEELRQLQAQILSEYAPMVKSGGVLVYATCSCLPSENEEQVRKFLRENPNWILEAELWRRPDRDPGDGFYGARLRRRS
ncbi:MAG: class I SAM-dependent methyltransferase [Bdellovibrionaceae bacterium]|nr:class I SAM-dependent methyltransferase [Pseudobdellovibrionaceae bacterium]